MLTTLGKHHIIGTIFTRYNQIDTIVQNPRISNLYEQNIDIKFFEADY